MEEIFDKIQELETSIHMFHSKKVRLFKEECPMISFEDGGRGYMSDSPCNARIADAHYSEQILDIINTHLTTVGALIKSL